MWTIFALSMFILVWAPQFQRKGDLNAPVYTGILYNCVQFKYLKYYYYYQCRSSKCDILQKYYSVSCIIIGYNYKNIRHISLLYTFSTWPEVDITRLITSNLRRVLLGRTKAGSAGHKLSFMPAPSHSPRCLVQTQPQQENTKQASVPAPSKAICAFIQMLN